MKICLHSRYAQSTIISRLLHGIGRAECFAAPFLANDTQAPHSYRYATLYHQGQRSGEQGLSLLCIPAMVAQSLNCFGMQAYYEVVRRLDELELKVKNGDRVPAAETEAYRTMKRMLYC